MPDTWQPILLSAKVFGHLSQGLYRTPAGAIKELVSNSFDADAKLVRIHTDFPRFESFSCEDNGTGMSREEFLRLMNRGIGSSYKRIDDRKATEKFGRPVIGRLGLGILALAQICPQFEIISHHRDSKTAFRAVIKFPPYTREEMDKITTKSDEDEIVQGGQYHIAELKYDADKQGVRVFTKYLRESFRKRMRTLSLLANKKVLGKSGPYKSFSNYLDAIYNPHKLNKSLNLLSDYDQLLFGIALAPPLPFVDDRNIATKIPMVRERQAVLKKLNFLVSVDNLVLSHPLCLPSDRDGHIASQCRIAESERRDFPLEDGAYKENCQVIRHRVKVEGSDEQFNVYEMHYANKNVAGSKLNFSGYLFQQTGRLYPRDVQGILIRLSNVAIGKYDNSMLTYPYAEGPRYAMVSSEIFVETGFEDALNIDRDSFNELHPHYMRVQSYVHGLLHEVIFPETWGEEKQRNRRRRERETVQRDTRFVETFRKATGEPVRAIQRIEKHRGPTSSSSKPAAASPVDFNAKNGRIEIDQTHPLLEPLFRRKKYGPLIEKLVFAFERANHEPNVARRRELFYRLMSEIFRDL